MRATMLHRPFSRALLALIGIVSIFSFSTDAADKVLLGTNPGAFADYLKSYPTDNVPMRAWGLNGAPWNQDTNTVKATSNALKSDGGTVTMAPYYDNGNYTLTFNSPQAVTVSPAGMFGAPLSSSRSGTITTMVVPVYHNNGIDTEGLGWFNVTGPSASNPVTQFHFTRPGGTSGELTPKFQSFLFRYPVARWMNGLPINNNIAVQTASDVPDQGNCFVTSYTDVCHWANESPVMQKVWINIPIGADDSYIVAVAQIFNDNLAPNKHVIVELANEVWNATFQQFFYTLNKAKSDSRVASTDDFGKIGEEYGLMAAHMIQVFRSQFTDQEQGRRFSGKPGDKHVFC